MPYRIFNVEEVAQYLNMSSADVQRMVRDGDIPFERRGDRAVFRRPEIDAWASQRILGLSASRLAEYQQKWSHSPNALLSRETLVSNMILSENIDAALTSRTRASVLRDMVALADGTGMVYDAAELVSTLQAREELCSTAVPGGVAFLHPRASQPYRFDSSFVVLGRAVQPIHFGSPDGQPTDLFFLICCQDEKLHLQLLARLCLLAQKSDLLADIRSAGDATAMHEAIVRAEEMVNSKLHRNSGKG